MTHYERFRLRSRHALLELQIETERLRPVPDALRLQSLKREKLAIKERLAAANDAQQTTA